MTRLLSLIHALGACVRSKSPSLDVTRLTESARSYLLSLETKISNEGKVQSCRHYKELHNCAIRIATQDTLPSIPFCKTDSKGIPLELKPVKWLLESDDAGHKRFGLTITRFYESIILDPVFDPDPIERPGPILNEQFVQKFSDFCSSWTSRINARNLGLRSRDKIIGNLVQGPNGPSIITSHYDASAVCLNSTLQKALYKLATITGNQWIYRLMTDIASDTPANNYLSGRISLLQQGGGKTRVIAIGDYWSQNLLRPIHDSIMNVLRRLETDGTWDQNQQVDRINMLAKSKAYSFDLSSATDRFPVKLQEILLSHVFSPELSEAWRTVMTQRPYSYKDKHYEWKQGQPLGLLSSWAVFALTHHAIIEYIAFEKGIKSFRDYAVLGDDVVIWNDKVASAYVQLMEEIGVSINWSKSLTSDDQHQRIEFAKRILFNGVEISGLKWDILKAASKSIYMFIDLLRVAQMRHWDLPRSEIEVPSYLSVKGQELLGILLWDYLGSVPAFAVTQTSLISIEDLKRKVLELRIESLRSKRDSVDKHLSSAKPIEELFNRGGIAVSERLIGLKGWSNSLHPVVWAVNQCGENLAIGLSILESVLDSGLDTTPEILPIEYLPIPTIGAYFGDRHSLRSEYHSQLVLKAWSALVKERNIQ